MGPRKLRAARALTDRGRFRRIGAAVVLATGVPAARAGTTGDAAALDRRGWLMATAESAWANRPG